ncbi:hypothetical protein SAOR_03525 [Salinisphaera orenii MK-B5]|uniref:Uncharacterized protein n=1 Tax=Salinisphaera orenii MK-B5 TaxID=856730 RepID=A0A423PVK3_9GAMM|nr:hypothetical protein SAOR_03525 [Salinisphaera orenii MK-B5]
MFQRSQFAFLYAQLQMRFESISLIFYQRPA